ncbi:MAG: hypothetical protein JO316_07625 [Abitibacteriaceae bacterium]|nr:hypothetical protein [Abditibacteriaceae bacterium]
MQWVPTVQGLAPHVGIVAAWSALAFMFWLLVLIAEILALFTPVILLGSAIWVIFDASRLGARHGQLRGFFDLSPWQWGFCCFMFSPVFFPAYCLSRPLYQKIATNPQLAASSLGIARPKVNAVWLVVGLIALEAVGTMVVLTVTGAGMHDEQVAQQQQIRESQDKRANLEENLKASINSDLQKRGETRTCTRVVLIKETDRYYKGVTEYSDNTRANVSVELDEDGRAMYETGPLGQ